MTAALVLNWATSPDSLRPGASVHSADLDSGGYVVVQETRVAEGDDPAEWTWTVCDSNGMAVHFRTGFVDRDGAAAVDRAKAHALAFCQEILDAEGP